MLDSETYLEKFGYREYKGTIDSRWRRIISLIRFEVVSTWTRSTFGKVLLIFLVGMNLITIMILASFNELINNPEIQRDILNSHIAKYLNFGPDTISSGIHDEFSFSMPLGIFIISLFAIAGSGMFADDKQGKVIEIYLSRLQKREYVLGKIGAIMVYINLFLMVPLLITGGLYVQSFGLDHLDMLDFYFGIILFSLITSLILGLIILSFSILVEKRAYASLGVFLFYIIGTFISQIMIELDSENEFLILLSPVYFLALLAFICLGDFHLGRIVEWRTEPFLLDDGQGLEYYHVILTAVAIITILSLFLAYKIKKMTTEEL